MELQWPLILFTFFLCVCGGTFAMQGALTLAGKGKKSQTISLIVSAVALVVGGLSVFMHLQHWERIFNAFGALLAGNGVGVSGITLELWGCVVFAIALVLYFLFMRRSEDGVAPKWCAVVAVIVGLALPAVTGDSYLMAALPAWDTPLLIAFYVVNAVLLGSLVQLVIAGVAGDVDVRDVLAKVAIAAAVVQGVVLVAYAAIIGSLGGSWSEVSYYFDPTLPDIAMVDAAATLNVLTGSTAVAFWVCCIAIGVVAAAAIAYLAKKAEGTRLTTLAASALACAVVGSFAWRCILYVVAISIFAMF